jgi:hypothetical protein
VSPERQPASELIERVLAGNDSELTRLAAEGMLPLPPADLLALQVRLASGPASGLASGEDEEVARTAQGSLAEVPAARVIEVIEEGASAEVVRWFALQRRETNILEAILRRRDVSRELLVTLAESLPPNLQELLLVRQDAIVEHPEILDSLARNPRLSSYAKRRIAEFHEHLISVHEPEEEEEEFPDEPSDEEVRAAVEEAAGRELAADEGGKSEKEDLTGLTEAQIRTLPVPVRRKLARTSRSRSLQNILLRDPNPQVAVTAMSGASLSDGEVEKLAASRSVVGEILEEIARRRDWINKYKVVSALVHNPRTPAGLAIRLVPRVSVRELRMLSRDHNVPNAVRTHAQRLYRMKRR